MPTNANPEKDLTKSQLRELTMIRKLLILQLVWKGAESEDIGAALGIKAGTARNMFPFRKAKKGLKKILKKTGE